MKYIKITAYLNTNQFLRNSWNTEILDCNIVWDELYRPGNMYEGENNNNARSSDSIRNENSYLFIKIVPYKN